MHADEQEGAIPLKPKQSNTRGKLTERSRRERLHPVLAEQRKEAVSSSRGVQAASEDVSRKTNTAKVTKKTPQTPKRVDLYLNETGYPQARTPMPGHESQELHSKRREHLAPHPPDSAGDALSGFVDAVAEHSKVSRPPRRRSGGSVQRPSGFRIPSYPARGANAQQSGDRQTLPGLRDRQSRFKAQGGPGANRSGPGGNRGGPAGVVRRPGQQRPRRGPSKPALVPVRMFDPAPKTVVGASSVYKSTAMLPEKGDVAKVHMAMHKAQWVAQRRDIEKALKGSGSAATVIRGDWQTYISPVIQAVKEAQKNKKGSNGVSSDQRKEILDRAGWGVALNPSLPLQQKLQVTEKVASLL